MPTYTDEELDALREIYLTSPITRGFSIFNGYTMPIDFEGIRKDIEDFEVYDDDIWICTFPKCGTTWTQEMVWCLCNNLDFEGAKVDLCLRFPFLERSCLFYWKDKKYQPQIIKCSVEHAKSAKRPRFIKSHLPWELLPKQIRTYEKRPKIIHVARNPMDTCVSFFYHCKLMQHFEGDFDLFAQLFLNHKLSMTPYDESILSYWNRRNEPNILFIKFEDLKSNLSMVVDTVANFLNLKLCEEGKEKLLEHLSFDSMKNNKYVAHALVLEFLEKNHLNYGKDQKFIRDGKSGGYRKEMPEEMIEIFKKRFVDKLEKAGLTFSV